MAHGERQNKKCIKRQIKKPEQWRGSIKLTANDFSCLLAQCARALVPATAANVDL